MKKIIIGYLVNGTHSGIDKYLLNFLENIKKDNDSNNIKIDFLTNKIQDSVKEAIRPYNCNLIEIPRLVNPIKQYKELKKIYKQGKYDIAYFNISEAFNCISSIAAKHARIERVIIHSHASGSSNANFLKRKFLETLNKIFKNILFRYGDLFLACSKKAGLWLFPKKIVNSDKFKIIYNAVDFNKYEFNNEIREKIRKEMKWTDKIVLGHVGNMVYAKNHKFIIECFNELAKKDDRYRLVLIGTGKLLEEVKSMVINLNLQDKIDFIGVVDNVNELMQAMDIFVFPSLFEGLGIAAIEAQISGLETILSDNLPNEVIISENSHILSINDKNKWINKIMELYNKPRKKAIFLENAKNYNILYKKEQYEEIIDLNNYKE